MRWYVNILCFIEFFVFFFLRSTGDPGSPIFEWDFDRWQQVGIASYIFDCAPFRSLGIYTRTVEYNDWIQSIINNCSAICVSSTTTTTISIANNATTTVKPPVTYPCNRTSTCGCGVAPVVLTPSRIVGGENAVESSWPMIVSLRLFNKDSHDCGGTILSDSYILTAAHCVDGVVSNPLGDVTIAVGMTNLSDPKQIRRTVDHIYIHPNYTGVEYHNPHDIAVLHLNQSLPTEYNQFLTKTCIHRVNPPTLNNQYIRNGTRLTVIGWGTRKSGLPDEPTILQQAEVYAIDYNDSICRGAMEDTEIQFCAGLAEGGKG
jgi:secreted trypsin-like serine protease